MKPKYSVLISCYNEEETINDFYQAIIPVMEAFTPFELIFINDGSKDKTKEVLAKLAEKDKRVKVINFSRNFTQQNAFYCGMKYMEGDVLITMDVDLQDPVEVLPKLISKWEEGYQIVHARRIKRNGENIFKKFSAWLYTRIVRKITKMDVPTEVGEFKLYDKQVVEAMLQMPEHNRFVRNMTTWMGFKQGFVDFERKERSKGKTKYNFAKLFKLSINGIIPYTHSPLFYGLKFGIILGALSEIAFIVFIVLVCMGSVLPLIAWLFPTVGLLVASILFNQGISNAYIAKIYDESLNRPQYIIESTYNIDKK